MSARVADSVLVTPTGVSLGKRTRPLSPA
ncbi:hypothetical protein [Microbacterium sp. SYP-A9085]